MFEEMILLATYSNFFSGGQIGELLSQWEQAGIFSYMLPFLLMFALVFGLLSKINIFGSATESNKGKGINAIISIAVALMALQFDVVSVFFSEIFPRMGVALSIILIVLVLGGLFIPTNKENNWFMVVLSIIVFIVIGTVIFNSFSALGWGIDEWGLSNFWSQYGSIVIFAVIIIAVVIIATYQPNPNKPKMENALTKLLGS